MRIISKFKDYYDISISYGIDKDIVYVRKTNEIQDHNVIEKFSKLDCIKKSFEMYNYMSGNIDCRIMRKYAFIICGKCFYCFEAIINDDTIFIYDIDDFNYFHKKWDKGIKESRTYVYDPKINFEDILIDNGKFHNYLIDVHLKYNSPIILAESQYPSISKKIIINPMLSKYDFYKVLDPYMMFQELSMFMSNIFGKSSNDMVDIGEKYKIEKHGFDYKKSFRNMKR